MTGKIVINENLCKGCQLCINFCPLKVIGSSKHLNHNGFYPAVVVNASKCTGCGICALMCPDAVIEVYREKEEARVCKS